MTSMADFLSDRDPGAALDTTMRVLMAERLPQIAARVKSTISDEKECQLSICDDPNSLLQTIFDSKPALLLINFDFLGDGLVDALNQIHHQDSSAHVIVYLCPPVELTKNSLILAGATECVDASAGLDRLTQSVTKALIALSERNCFSGGTEISMQEVLPEIVFSLDMDGKCVYMNSSVHHLLGYEKEELISHDFCNLISNESHRAKFQDYLARSSELVMFDGVLTLQTSLGIDEDFRVHATLMEGEIVCGTAKKVGLGLSTEEWQEAQKIESVMEESERNETMEETVLPSRLGPYRVLSLMGEGAMGRVYKGFDEHLERYVAIKVLNTAITSKPDGLEGFRREARILASISHPNIALIYYFDICNNVPFFCMEYLPEGSVDSLLSRNKTLEPATAMSFIYQVAMGLKKAQEQGVVHLDIKPSNLMIAEKNRIKIVDFGLAVTHSDFSSNLIIGTPSYLAPEQIHEGTIDHRCDIYSLGITFFEMVYGFLPFTGKNVKEVFAKKLNEDLPGPELLNAMVPMSLYHLISHMVARDPAKRIQNYSELIEKLEDAKKGITRRSVTVQRDPEKSLRIKGNLSDTPFAEVLGQIWKEQLTGRLTLKWLDLSKVIHFHSGTVTAVLSNQEGERFIDLLISEKQLEPGKAWNIRTAPSDLFTKFSSAMELIKPEGREILKSEFESLAYKILENLFGWAAGDFVFEEGEYPEQPHIHIDASDLLSRGIHHHADSAAITRKLMHGKVNVIMSSDCMAQLRLVRLNSSERSLLMKTEKGISYSEFHSISKLPRDMFSRVVYLFFCLGFIRLEGTEPTIAAAQPQEAAPQPEIDRPEKTPEQPFSLMDTSTAQPLSIKDTPAPPLTPQSSAAADQYCQQAADDYYQENYWSAVQNCKKALELRQDFRIYHLMGKALAKHSGFKYDAMKALKAAYELNPKNLGVQKDMADLYLASDNQAMALFHYKKILAVDPSDEHSKAKIYEIEHSNDVGRIIVKKVGQLLGRKKKPKH